MAGEVSRLNGMKGGRPKGVRSTPLDIKAAAKKAVEDFYCKHAMAFAQEHVKIAFQGKFEPTRLQACERGLDRVIGKTVQPHEGNMDQNITVIVHTGVPRLDDD